MKNGRHGLEPAGISSRFDLPPGEAAGLQRRLSEFVRSEWDGRGVHFIAGVDVHFPFKNTARAAIVVAAWPGLEVVETSCAEFPCSMPYIPGLLSFREIPPVLEALRALAARPDLILCDGHGLAHPRGFGMASHLGLLLDTPSIGCAKSHLFGSFTEPGPLKGETAKVIGKSGAVIGAVLRTRDRTRPVYVSVGHLIDLENALRFVLGCCPRYRIPVPLREAHRLAGGR